MQWFVARSAQTHYPCWLIGPWRKRHGTHDDVIEWKHFPRSAVTGEFPAQRPVTRSFDVFFDLRLNKPLSKESWGWWFETLWCPSWRHFNGNENTFFLNHGIIRYDTEPFSWNIFGRHIRPVIKSTEYPLYYGSGKPRINKSSPITSFMGLTWGPPGAVRTQVGSVLATWTLLSGLVTLWYRDAIGTLWGESIG